MPPRAACVLERSKKIFIEFLDVVADLFLELLALEERVVLFRISGGDFLAVMQSSKTSSTRGSPGVSLASGQSFARDMRHKGRLDELRLDEFFKTSWVTAKSGCAGLTSMPSLAQAASFSSRVRANHSASPVASMMRSLYFASRHCREFRFRHPRGARTLVRRRGCGEIG